MPDASALRALYILLAYFPVNFVSEAVMLPVMLLPQSGVGINSYSLHNVRRYLSSSKRKESSTNKRRRADTRLSLSGSYAWPCGLWTGSGGWEHGR